MKGMGAHFKEDGMLYSNQYKLFMLHWQFYFYKTTKMTKFPKLT